MKNTIEVCYDECKDPNYPVPIKLDTEFWFDWLKTHRSFRFVCNYGNISVLKDNNGYWTASKKVDGGLRRKRLGVSHSITSQQLTDACKLLCVNGLWKEHLQEQDQKYRHSEKGYKETLDRIKERLETVENQYQQALQTIKELTNENRSLKEKSRAVSQSDCDTDSQAALQSLIKKYKSNAKDTRNWVEAKRLIHDLESILKNDKT